MEHEVGKETLRFGGYLRRLREDKRFSLDTVAELSSRYPERLTKSHLSRIENGQALPTVPRLLTLGQIYGISLASLAERYEIEFKCDRAPDDLDGLTVDQILDRAGKLLREGLPLEALVLYETLLAFGESNFAPDEYLRLQLLRIQALAAAEHYRAAKEEAEDLLSENLPDRQRIDLMLLFARCTYRLGKHAVALIILNQVHELIERSGGEPDSREFIGCKAQFEILRGNILRVMQREKEAFESFVNARKMFEHLGDGFEACKCRLNAGAMLSVLGKPRQSKIELLAALQAAEKAGYHRLAASALSNLAEIAFQGREWESSESYALRSNRIAREGRYATLIFRNCFYLWRIATELGREREAASHSKTLHCYYGRVDSQMPEAVSFKDELTGEASR